MQILSCNIRTYCVGQAASLGAILLAAGTKGKRYSLPNARIMIHQPWGGTQGSAVDIGIQAKEIIRLRSKLNKILAEHTGKKMTAIEKMWTGISLCLLRRPATMGSLIQFLLLRKLMTKKITKRRKEIITILKGHDSWQARKKVIYIVLFVADLAMKRRK